MTAGAADYARSMLVAESQAVEDSIEIVRLKKSGDHTVIAAVFANRSGRQVRAMLGMREVEGRWRGTGGFSGSGSAGEARVSWSSGGWSHGSRIVRGFWVGHPSAVALRLTDSAGEVRQDDIDAAVAILIWDGTFGLTDARVELVNAQGDVIKAGPVWPAPSLVD